MNLSALFGGDPKDWVPSHGRPARILGNKGMASYESPDQRILILDAVLAVTSITTGWIVGPLRYQPLCEAFPEGFIAIRSRRQWRPKLHWLRKRRTWQSMGSQEELLWRWDTSGREWRKATERAKQVLLDNLTEHQRLELILTNKFTVVGGKTRSTYRVEIGNGFESVSRVARQTLVSYCLHPEYFMPHEDVALATKLLLEDPETEEDVLDRAQAYPRRALMRSLMLASDRPDLALKYPRPRKPTRREWYIADMERELLK